MTEQPGVTRRDIFRLPGHSRNQMAARTFANGDIVAVFNEERFPNHHDSGQTRLVGSCVGGVTWDAANGFVIREGAAATANRAADAGPAASTTSIRAWSSTSAIRQSCGQNRDCRLRHEWSETEPTPQIVRCARFTV